MMMWQGVGNDAAAARNLNNLQSSDMYNRLEKLDAAANRNLDNLQSSDRFKHLEKEVAGIINQDMKQH